MIQDTTTGDGHPTISVVVPTHGRPRLVRETVGRILSQDYPGIVETIVVHDGEEPNQSLAQDDPLRPVKVIRNTHVRGLTGVRNSGLAVVSGDLIAWCDDDDLWHTDKLSVQVQLLHRTPGAMAVGAGHTWVSADRDQTSELRPPFGLVTQDRVLKHGNGPLGLHSSTVLVRREAYDLVGGYDESLPQSRCEDLEFFLRASTLGPIPILQRSVADIRFDPYSAFTAERHRTIAETLQVLLTRYPQYEDSPAAKSRISYQIAINYSQAGNRKAARRWSRAALVAEPSNHRAAAVAVVTACGINVRSMFRCVRTLRRLADRGLVNSRLRGAVR